MALPLTCPCLAPAGIPGWLLSPCTLPRSAGSVTSARGCSPPGGAAAGCWTPTAPAPPGATQYRVTGLEMFDRQTPITLFFFKFRILKTQLMSHRNQQSLWRISCCCSLFLSFWLYHQQVTETRGWIYRPTSFNGQPGWNLKITVVKQTVKIKHKVQDQ